jgi:hypothetical protein
MPEVEADQVHEHDEQCLGHHRVPQALGRGDGRVEPHPGGVRNQAALEELPDHRAHPLMHDQLRQDEQGQRQQEAGVYLEVPGTAPRPRRPPAPGSLDRQGSQAASA